MEKQNFYCIICGRKFLAADMGDVRCPTHNMYGMLDNGGNELAKIPQAVWEEPESGDRGDSHEDVPQSTLIATKEHVGVEPQNTLTEREDSLQAESLRISLDEDVRVNPDRKLAEVVISRLAFGRTTVISERSRNFWNSHGSRLSRQRLTPSSGCPEQIGGNVKRTLMFT